MSPADQQSPGKSVRIDIGLVARQAQEKFVHLGIVLFGVRVAKEPLRITNAAAEQAEVERQPPADTYRREKKQSQSQPKPIRIFVRRTGGCYLRNGISR